MWRAKAKSRSAATRNSSKLTRVCGTRGLSLLLVLCGTWGCAAPRPAPAPAAQSRTLSETDQVIEDVLSDMRLVESSQPQPKPRASAAASGLPRDADSFDADRERIRATVSQWPHGTGATLRFLKEATGERLSLIFVDDASPEFDRAASTWTAKTQARVSGGKVVGHFLVRLTSLRPGRYRGDDHTKEVEMGVLMGNPTWNARDPETAWSSNRESWCEVQLSSDAENVIEGNFRARLVDNKGTGFINIDSGYLFIKR